MAINLSAAEINNLQLKEVVSTRSKTGGRHPGMTTAEIMGKLYREEGEEVTSLFNSPQRQPTEVEKKVMLAQVIKVAMLAVLQNHTYQFKNNEARLQSDGGPIGLELAGAMARVVMIWWDQGGITCGAIDEPRKSSKAIDERVIINFRDKNVVIARFRDKNVYR